MTFQRTRRDGCLSDLTVDRLLADELDPADHRAAQAHVGSCARCSARVAELDGDRARYRLAPPPFPAHRERRSARWGRWRPWLVPVGAIAAAAGLVLLLRPGGRSPMTEDATHVKGSIRLGFYVKRGDSVHTARSGDVVHPGEAVRFTYTTRTPGYLALVSRDGSGEVSVYYPDEPAAAPLPPAEDEPLPGSIVLDDALGFEAVYAVFCSEPPAVTSLVAQLRRGQDLVTIPGCSVDKAILEKRPHE
jgi:hypothetical protein